MNEQEFDVVGIRSKGVVAGFVRRQELSQGPAGDYIAQFNPQKLLPEGAPIVAAFEALRDHRYVFVNVLYTPRRRTDWFHLASRHTERATQDEKRTMHDRFAFIDTSIFLHYRPFDEVDWLSILGVNSVSIVLAPVIISELNDKKDEPTPKLRQRAASCLKKLEALWSKGPPVEVRRGVGLLVQDVEPSIDYAAHQLDYRSQDDRLIASIIQFVGSNPGAAVVLVTADFGLRVKAKGNGIETMGLPDELKLPEEPDPNEKLIQELQPEVLELKRATPELELTFSNGTNRLEVSLDPPVNLSREELERERKMIRLTPRLGATAARSIGRIVEERNGEARP